MAVFVLIREQSVFISKHLALLSEKKAHLLLKGHAFYFGNHKLRNNECLAEVTKWNT